MSEKRSGRNYSHCGRKGRLSFSYPKRKKPDTCIAQIPGICLKDLSDERLEVLFDDIVCRHALCQKLIRQGTGSLFDILIHRILREKQVERVTRDCTLIAVETDGRKFPDQILLLIFGNLRGSQRFADFLQDIVRNCLQIDALILELRVFLPFVSTAATDLLRLESHESHCR